MEVIQLLERFELLEKIGSGGMGTVWKARDTERGEVVALKIVHPHLAEDADYIARFEREVEVARRIESPYVVKVFGYGTREGVPYMAMEYVEGQSLRDRLRSGGPMTWEQAKPVVRQVAEGLGAAHEAGVIHRDVKPSNILMTKDGTAKLADFGIARALDLTRLTGSSTMLGTPHYMAPEGTASPQSDLYALGCVLFEMLTGHPPFEGDSQQAVIAAHIRDAPRTTELSGEASSVVEWLLAKRPESRPSSTQVFLNGLDLERGARPKPRRLVGSLAIATSLGVVVLIGTATALAAWGGASKRPAAPIAASLSPIGAIVATETLTPAVPDDHLVSDVSDSTMPSATPTDPAPSGRGQGAGVVPMSPTPPDRPSTTSTVAPSVSLSGTSPPTQPAPQDTVPPFTIARLARTDWYEANDTHTRCDKSKPLDPTALPTDRSVCIYFYFEIADALPHFLQIRWSVDGNAQSLTPGFTTSFAGGQGGCCENIFQFGYPSPGSMVMQFFVDGILAGERAFGFARR